ncbi:hypothetical protein OC834_006709 [Tilletia horrida]|nr:hypothetical protein OC834_006709 [Tilletia horrida]
MSDVETELAGFHIAHLPAYNVLICRTCGSAIDWLHLKRHYGTYKHDQAPHPDHLHRIAELAEQIPSLIKSPSKLARPAPDSAALPVLASRSGWWCSTCDTTFVEKRKVGEHTDKCTGKASVRSCRLQSWQQKGAYFPVEVAGHRNVQPAPAAATTSTSPSFQALRQAIQIAASAAHLDPVTLLPNILTAAELSKHSSAWLRHSRWPTLLRGVDLALASLLIRAPERLLALVASSLSDKAQMSAADMHAQLLDRIQERLTEAYSSLTEHATPNTLELLRCDDTSYAPREPRRQFHAEAPYVRKSVKMLAHIFGVGFTLWALQRSGLLIADGESDEESGGKGEDGEAEAEEEDADGDPGSVDSGYTLDDIDAEDEESPGGEPATAPAVISTQALATLRPLLRAVAGLDQALMSAVDELAQGKLHGKTITTLLFAVLQQPIHGAGHSSLLVTFSALRGLVSKAGGRDARVSFSPPATHGEQLVRLIFGVRVGLWAIAEDAVPRRRKQQTEDAFYQRIQRLLERIRCSFGVLGVDCAMAVLYGQRNYACGCRGEGSGAYRVVWDPSGQQFVINGEVVRIVDIKTMCNSLLDDFELRVEQLDSRPAGQERPKLDPANLFDNAGERAAGYSIVHERRNTHIIDKHSTLLTRLSDHLFLPVDDEEGDEEDDEDEDEEDEPAHRLRKPVIVSVRGKSYRLNQDECMRLFRIEQQLLRTLFAAIFWTAGTANRGSELSSILVYNKAEQQRDYVLGPDGRVILETSHSKSAWRALYTDKILRALPPRLDEPFLYHLISQRPGLDYLRLLCFGASCPERLFINADGSPMAEEGLGNLMRSKTSLHGLGFPAGLLTCRHIQATTAHFHMQRAFVERFLSGPREDDQAGRRRRRGGSSRRAAEDSPVNTEPDPFIDLAYLSRALHEQANHTVTTAGIHYLDDVGTRKSMPADRQVAALVASQAWHQIVGVAEPSRAAAAAEGAGGGASATETAPAPVAAAAAAPAAAPPASSTEPLPFSGPPSDPLPRALSPDVVRAMAWLLGRPTACKTRGQARALSMLDQPGQSMLVILPTGAGKSLVWQVASALAHSKGQLVALLLPYEALRQDAQRAAERVRLKAHVWTGRGDAASIPHGTDVLITSVDQAFRASGRQLLHELAAAGRLARVCLDEAHVLFADRWREVMLIGWQLGLVPVPLLLLSATIPPTSEAELAHAVFAPQLAVIRESAQQLNLAFHVEQLPSAQGLQLLSAEHPVNKATIDLIRRTDAELAAGGILVICRFKSQVDALARSLGCKAFYSLKEDEEQERRKEMDDGLSDFLSGRTKMICGTSALGTGVHRPDIRLVVHAGQPYSLLQLVQSGGRAGRDGQRAGVHTILTEQASAHISSTATTSLDPDTINLSLHLSGTECRRRGIGRLLDRSDQGCFELGGVMCDVCAHFGDMLRGELEDVGLWHDPDATLVGEEGQEEEEEEEHGEGAAMAGGLSDEDGDEEIEEELDMRWTAGKRPLQGAFLPRAKRAPPPLPLAVPPRTSFPSANRDGDQAPRASSSSSTAAEPLRLPLPPAGAFRRGGATSAVPASTSTKARAPPATSAADRRNEEGKAQAQASSTMAQLAIANANLCGYCFALNIPHQHGPRACQQPKMQAWRSRSLKYIINYPPGLACKDCGLPFFLCRDQTGTSACCSPARNTFLPGVLFALATDPDLFSDAQRRVQARHPKLKVSRPRFGPQSTEIPHDWTETGPLVDGHYETFVGFWLALGALKLV